MKRHQIALFGEAEKGTFHQPCLCRSLEELVDRLGHPPEESQGLILAIQTLLFEQEVLFFRVHQEGFSAEDYLSGLHFIESKAPTLEAVAVPGVGDPAIIDRTSQICNLHQSFLILTEKDLYDYITSFNS